MELAVSRGCSKRAVSCQCERSPVNNPSRIKYQTSRERIQVMSSGFTPPWRRRYVMESHPVLPMESKQQKKENTNEPNVQQKRATTSSTQAVADTSSLTCSDDNILLIGFANLRWQVIDDRDLDLRVDGKGWPMSHRRHQQVCTRLRKLVA